MARNGSGTYYLPTGNPVVTNTVIESTWANSTMSDVASEITNSLPRDGQAPMTAVLKIVDGTVSAPGIAFNSDSNTGMFRSATDTLVLTTGGKNRFQVDQDGAVVCSTDAATNPFTINQTGASLHNFVRFQLSGVSKGAVGVSGGASGLITGSVSGDLAIKSASGSILFSTNDGGTEHARISTSGYLGIGTTSPQNLIHLVGNTAAVSATQLIIEGKKGGYGAGISFYGEVSDATTKKEMAKITADSEDTFTNTAATQDAGLHFFTMNDGTLAERVQIDKTGNVSVKTGGLSVTNGSISINSANPILTFIESDTGQTRYIHQDGGVMYFTKTSGNAMSLDNSGNAVISGNATASSMYASNWFRSSGATGWYNETYAGGLYMTENTWVRVYNNKHLLVENASVSASPAIQATTGNVSAYAIVGRPGNASYGGVLGYSQNSSYYGILGHANQYALYGSGDIYVSGNITAYSDQRAKQNIRTFDNALATVEQLRGVKFQWKRDYVEDVGMIAQEVQKIIPEVVKETPEGSLGINYGVLVGVLIEAVKELSAMVKGYRYEHRTVNEKYNNLEADYQKKVEELVALKGDVANIKKPKE